MMLILPQIYFPLVSGFKDRSASRRVTLAKARSLTNFILYFFTLHFPLGAPSRPPRGEEK